MICNVSCPSINPKIARRRMKKLPHIAVIPAFEPTAVLEQIVQQLCKYDPTLRIVVIDDGSTTKTALEVFISLERYENVQILKQLVKSNNFQDFIVTRTS